MNRRYARLLALQCTQWLLACGGPFGDGVFEPLPDPGIDPGETGGAGGAGGAFVPPLEPPPGPVCLYGSDCAPDAYCHRPFGTCFGVGTCQPRPAACDPAENAPVCDCLGTEHASPCAAAMAGRNVAYPGACGGECDQNADCAAGQVCRRLTDVGQGPLGTCGAPPTDCGQVNPICRENPADGNAPNECDAAENDTWIVGPGPCGACLNEGQCQTGADGFEVRDVCVLPAGRCDERVFGTCRSIGDHDMCSWQIANGDPDPVCTCGGGTLPAACEANWRGLQIDHVGACGAP